MPGRALLRRLVRANERCSYAVTKIWPRDRGRPNRLYLELVVAAIRERKGQFVVDVGGGSSLRYARLIEGDEAHVVAVDESAEELVRNTDVHETRTADASVHLPFEDASVDVITSSSVLEHLRDMSGFLDEAARVLRDGAVMVHIFPARYASFAIVNRLLPERVKRALLFGFYPDTEGRCGFRAYYDCCSYHAIVRECETHGFRVELADVSYYGASDYYRFFFPVFFVSWLWELTIRLARARSLAAVVVLQARRLPRRPEPAAA